MMIKTTRITRFLTISAAVFTLFMGPLAALPARAEAAARRLTVAAAADLTNALNEIAASFEKETGTKVVISYGSTGMLAAQIRAGAPFDLFFSADRRQVESLAKDGFIVADTVALYGRGRIVLAVNKASSVKVEELKELLNEKVRHVAIANPDHAPYGRAAKEALEAAGIWDAVKGKIVYGENIRQTLQYVQSGNAEAGIVALSIANAPEVTHKTIDESLHSPIEQAVGVVKKTKETDAARAFIRYVNGDEGRRVLKRYGFVTP